jgi:spore germination protein YaaH
MGPSKLIARVVAVALLVTVGQLFAPPPAAAAESSIPPTPARTDGDQPVAADDRPLQTSSAVGVLRRVRLAGELAAEQSVEASPARATVAPAASARRTLMYYVPGEVDSWWSLDAAWDAIDLVAGQWVEVDACGGLTSHDDQALKATARARGAGLLPSLMTYSGAINHLLLTDPVVADNLIRNIVEYVVAEDYAGFDADLEAIEPEDRAAYSAFIARLAEALHARGKLLTIAVPPKEREVSRGLAAAYDYAVLGRYADVVTLMTYDYAGSWGEPGAVAPYGPVERAVAYAASQIPHEKVNLGLAFYGYDWNVTTASRVRAFGHERATELARRHGATIGLDPETRSATFTYRGAADEAWTRLPSQPQPYYRVTVRRAAPCAAELPSGPPSPTRQWPTQVGPQEHVVWYEDARSAAARLEIAERHGTGVAGWRLGLEDPTVWPILRRWRNVG